MSPMPAEAETEAGCPAKAKSARRWALVADPRTIGMSGITQDESIESKPAKKPKV